MKYNTAIFDLDGTILDTLEDLKISINFALTQCGMPERTIDEVRAFVGNGIRLLTERSVTKNAFPDEVEAVFSAFNKHYALHCTDHTKPYEGISGMLLSLRSEGIKTAVVSNKADYAVKILCEQYFGSLFDYAVGARDGVRKKPYPDAVNAVLENFGTDAECAVFIGDSDVDVKTAQNAGVDCIAVDWGFRSRKVLTDAGAEIIVSSPAALTDIILGRKP